MENAVQAIWNVANAVLSTTTVAGYHWGQQFAILATICAIDEAEAECLIPWKGKKPCALVTDQHS
jgi:hypothetical protein